MPPQEIDSISLDQQTAESELLNPLPTEYQIVTGSWTTAWVESQSDGGGGTPGGEWDSTPASYSYARPLNLGNPAEWVNNNPPPPQTSESDLSYNIPPLEGADLVFADRKLRRAGGQLGLAMGWFSTSPVEYETEYGTETFNGSNGQYMHGKLKIEWDPEWPANLSEEEKEVWMGRYLVVLTERSDPPQSEDEPRVISMQPLKDVINQAMQVDPGSPRDYGEIARTRELILLPMEFKTYPDTEAGPDKAHKINLTTRQDEKTFYGQGWEKCVSKVWDTSNTVNLIDYLDGGPGNHATYENVVKWKVNGTEQISHELSLGSEPGEDAHRHYYIQVLPKNGGDTIDRLIITLVPRSTKTNFDNWYTAEKADLAWLGELVNLFSSFSTTPQPDGYYRRPDRNFNPFLYSVPGDTNTRMHPDAYFENRSYATPGGHAHQMCFKADGTLLQSGVSAGSADKAAAFPQNINPYLHIDADVKPFIWALQLDGTPADQQTTTLSSPIMHEGANLKKYSECRPAIANSKPILADGATP